MIRVIWRKDLGVLKHKKFLQYRSLELEMLITSQNLTIIIFLITGKKINFQIFHISSELLYLEYLTIIQITLPYQESINQIKQKLHTVLFTQIRPVWKEQKPK